MELFGAPDHCDVQQAEKKFHKKYNRSKAIKRVINRRVISSIKHSERIEQAAEQAVAAMRGEDGEE